MLHREFFQQIDLAVFAERQESLDSRALNPSRLSPSRAKDWNGMTISSSHSRQPELRR
jgi:hypothetical protein